MKGKLWLGLTVVLAVLFGIAAFMGLQAEAFAVLIGTVAGAIAGGVTSTVIVIGIALRGRL